jgi:hypothetical protein
LTGTASSRDLYAFRDAGANPALDFLDCGWPSTAGCPTGELVDIAGTLVSALRGASVNVAVLEIADGLLQPETAALLVDLRPLLGVPSVVFTARESIAAVAGVERLTALGYWVSAVSGVVTNSPLACREIELGAGVRCIRTADLGESARSFVGALRQDVPGRRFLAGA